MELFKENNIPFEVERYSAKISNSGEDGCTDSHMDILKKQTQFPFVIFEDDCVLLEDWSLVEKAMSQLPLNWDALWLGANVRRPVSRYSDNLFRLRRGFATHAIIYGSARIVNFILNRKEKLARGVNFDVFYAAQLQWRFNCFITYPMMATQRSDFSDIAKVYTNNYQELIDNYNKCIK